MKDTVPTAHHRPGSPLSATASPAAPGPAGGRSAPVRWLVPFLFLLLSCLLALPLAAGQRYRQHLVIAGTGDSQELLRHVAHDFMARHPGILVEVPESTGSGGGIKAVLAGTCQMARVARPLTQREKEQGLTYLLFARAPVVFAIHPSVQGVRNLTREQIIGIYTGRIRTWGQLGGSPDRKIYVANREAGDSSRRILEHFLPGFRDIRTFVGETIYTTPETVAILRSTPGTIGYIPLSAAAGTGLGIPSLDGFAPTGKAVASGDYPLAIPLALVWKDEPSAPQRLFIRFLLGPEGRRIIEEYGAFPVR